MEKVLGMLRKAEEERKIDSKKMDKVVESIGKVKKEVTELIDEKLDEFRKERQKEVMEMNWGIKKNEGRNKKDEGRDGKKRRRE